MAARAAAKALAPVGAVVRHVPFFNWVCNEGLSLLELAQGYGAAMRNAGCQVPRVQLYTFGIGALGMRMFMPAITDQSMQCMGNVWAISPELCGFLNELSISCSLTSHALVDKLNNVVRVSLHPWPRLFCEQTARIRLFY